MIQLSKNQTTNTVAVLPDTEITGTIVGLRFSGSQDYNRNTASFDGDLISNFDNTDWAIAQISGSTLPSASGLYTFDVIRIITSGPAIWNTFNEQWQLADTPWDDAMYFELGEQLTTVRAYNSGSDVPVFTQYQSPNENGFYTTYLG